MNAGNSSLAAAALYDLKNEQLQLANAALQQQGSSVEHKQQEASVSTTTDQSAATTAEGHQFAEGGTSNRILSAIITTLFLLSRNGSGNSFRIGSISIIQRSFSQFTSFSYLESSYEKSFT